MINLFVHHVAFKKGPPEKRDQYGEQAARLALKPTSLPLGELMRAWFYEDVQDHKRAGEVWKNARDVGDFGAFHYAFHLLRERSPAEALEEFEASIQSSGPLVKASKGHILAELPDRHGDAERIARELLDEPHTLDTQLNGLAILLKLGKHSEVAEIAKELVRSNPKGQIWYELEVTRYLAGQVLSESLTDGAPPARRQVAHLYIGLNLLSHGNRAAARIQFQNCVDCERFPAGLHAEAKTYLKHLEDDPTWPAWIPESDYEAEQ